MMYDRDYLKEWRDFIGLSQEALGERIGVSGAHVSRIESGKRVWKPRHLQRLKVVVNERLAGMGHKLLVEHVAELLACDPAGYPVSLITGPVRGDRLYQMMRSALARELGPEENIGKQGKLTVA